MDIQNECLVFNSKQPNNKFESRYARCITNERVNSEPIFDGTQTGKHREIWFPSQIIRKNFLHSGHVDAR